MFAGDGLGPAKIARPVEPASVRRPSQQYSNHGAVRRTAPVLTRSWNTAKVVTPADDRGSRPAPHQLFDLCRPSRQHGALVDVTLVGDLTRVDRRRLGEQKRMGRVRRCAATLRPQCRQSRLHPLAHGAVREHVAERRVRRRPGARDTPERSETRAARSHCDRDPSARRRARRARARRRLRTRSMPTLTTCRSRA